MVVIRQFNLQQFSRIGFRVHQLFKTDTLEQAKEYVKNLKIFTTNLPDETIEEVNHTIIVSEKEWKSRIAIAPAEQNVEIDPATLKASQIETRKLAKGQKESLMQKLKARKSIESFPLYAVLVDIDSYVEDPPIGELKIMDFVKETYKASLEKAKKYMGG